MTEKDAASLTDGVGDQSVVLEFLLKGLVKNVSGYLQQFLSHRLEIIHGQPTMPLRHGLGQGVGNASSGPDHRRLLDAECLGDLVSRQEPNAFDVPRKTVWILTDQRDRVGAVRSCRCAPLVRSQHRGIAETP